MIKKKWFGSLRPVDHKVRSSRPAWPRWWNLVSTKNTKISWMWWWAPVVPATWESRAGESLETTKQRLQWAKITSLHSILVTERNSVSKIKINIILCLITFLNLLMCWFYFFWMLSHPVLYDVYFSWDASPGKIEGWFFLCRKKIYTLSFPFLLNTF